MCGIAGIAASGFDRDAVVRMTAQMTHRGPDDEGFFYDQAIALGQRRLSIVDLEGGRQPIGNEDGTLQLICNGEIYNSPQLRKDLEQRGHRFRTRTDSEVILHLYEEYGRSCMQRLRGMFAFAIWDAKKRSLLIARDHMGQKPLFFCQKGDTFVFASEIKAILASGLVQPQLDLDALWHYVSLRFVPDRYTFFKDVQKLPAATSLYWHAGKFDLEKYWNPDFRDKLAGSLGELTEQLESLLRETVAMHLLSDVPIGTFLSGGIDSGLVSALVSQVSTAKVPAFSIGVQDERFNELPFARQVVERWRLEGNERIVNPDLIQIVPKMIWHLDEPSDPFGFGVYLVSELAAEKVKVVLGGDGGDESFAGYDRFAGQGLVDLYCAMPAWFRRQVMTRLINFIPESFAYKSLAQKAAWMNEMSFFSAGERYAQSMSFLRFTPESKARLFTPAAQQRLADPNSIDKILCHFNAYNVRELVDRMLYTDLMTRMPDHLLAIVDRMSMAHSLENRSPLVDHEVVEFAARIPGTMKLNGRKLKYILKKVAVRHLPKELITRPKQGFSFPIGTWMRTHLKSLMSNLFRQSRFVAQDIFDAGEVQRLWQDHISGKADHNYRLWILLNLELWHRLFFEGETPESLSAKMLDLSERRN
jgi:asparagine synthase (glutamine-hydrolysing)